MTINMAYNRLPLHPEKVLAEVYTVEMELNQTDLAKLCGCSPRKINKIVNSNRGISPTFAIALELVLCTRAEMWARMQVEYDLWEARQEGART
jgi:addiction module HigA family antidote|tara:strand:- start:82 stop:360 length:279 start_codon:yes stop_codon:yes gene_type:complete